MGSITQNRLTAFLKVSDFIYAKWKMDQQENKYYISHSLDDNSPAKKYTYYN